MLATFTRHELQFKVPARTSRGEYKTKSIYIISLEENGIQAIGEAAPLPGLSIDPEDKMEAKLKEVCRYLYEKRDPRELNHTLELNLFPSIRFALESAFENLKNKGQLIFPSAFTNQNKGIPVNGLVWMDDIEGMWKQVEKKISEGYSCIKIKIGALDFDQECRLLERIRKRYSAFKTELRVDANGGFPPGDAAAMINDLRRFELHSLEQPVKPKQADLMQKLCSESRVPIALDEELIGIEEGQISSLLRHIHPQYIVLKPGLLGGFHICDQWIKKSADLNIGFWITSALESNIGLNEIAQYCGKLDLSMAQGLGTGALYENNFASKLEIGEGKMYYNPN